MDDEKRKTLTLIEVASRTLSVADRGKQLLHIVKDYIEDGDLRYAKGVLERIETSYFTEHLPKQLPEDSLLSESLAIVVEAFGADLAVFKRSGASA
jgi:hypothetical protein